MRSEEAYIGMRVKVSGDYRKSELREMNGTIVHRYGDISYLALDVLLDDGRSELFWHHELDATESTR